MRHSIGGAQRLDIDEVEAERHRDGNRAAGVGGEVAHQGARELPDLQRRQDRVGGGENAEPELEASLGVALEIAELRQRVGQPRHRWPRQAGMQCEVGVRQRAAAVAESRQHVEPMRQRGREGGIGVVLRRSGPRRGIDGGAGCHGQRLVKFGTLSIYRNKFANRVDIRLGSASKDGR